MTSMYITLTLVAIFLYAFSFLKVAKTYGTVTPLLGWLVGLIFFVLMPLTAIVFNGGYKFPDYYNVSGEWAIVELDAPYFFYSYIVIWTSLVLTAFAVLIYTISKKSKQQRNAIFFITSRNRPAIYILSLVVIVSFIFRLSIYGGVEKYLMHDWYLRDLDYVTRFGKAFVFLQYVEIALQVLVAALSALVLTNPIKRANKFGLLLWLLVLMILNMLLLGNRIYFALLIIYWGCFLLVKRDYKKILTLCILLPFFLIVFSSWTALRSNLSNPLEGYNHYAESVLHDNQAAMSVISNVTELSNVMLLIHIIRDYGDKYDFLYGATYSRTFTWIVPRSLYENRPQNFSVTIAKNYEPTADTSLSSTVIGEMYANFGIFTIFIIPAFTVLLCLINGKLFRFLNQYSLTNVTLFMFLIWLSRSTFSENIVVLVIACFLIRVLKLERASNAFPIPRKFGG